MRMSYAISIFKPFLFNGLILLSAYNVSSFWVCMRVCAPLCVHTQRILQIDNNEPMQLNKPNYWENDGDCFIWSVCVCAFIIFFLSIFHLSHIPTSVYNLWTTSVRNFEHTCEWNFSLRFYNCTIVTQWDEEKRRQRLLEKSGSSDF